MKSAAELGVAPGVRVGNRGDMANPYEEGTVTEVSPDGQWVTIDYDKRGRQVGTPLWLFVRPGMGGRPRLVVL